MHPVAPRPESAASELDRMIHTYDELTVDHKDAKGAVIRLEAELENIIKEFEGHKSEGKNIEE